MHVMYKLVYKFRLENLRIATEREEGEEGQRESSVVL